MFRSSFSFTVVFSLFFLLLLLFLFLRFWLALFNGWFVCSFDGQWSMSNTHEVHVCLPLYTNYPNPYIFIKSILAKFTPYHSFSHFDRLDGIYRRASRWHLTHFFLPPKALFPSFNWIIFFFLSFFLLFYVFFFIQWTMTVIDSASSLLYLRYKIWFHSLSCCVPSCACLVRHRSFVTRCIIACLFQVILVDSCFLLCFVLYHLFNAHMHILLSLFIVFHRIVIHFHSHSFPWLPGCCKSRVRTCNLQSIIII